FVQRAAADALGRHSSAENVRPLLDLHHTVPKDDPQLLHTVRMALREQLRPPQAWKQPFASRWSAADARAVAGVAPGVPSREATEFLLNHLQHQSESAETVVRYVHHVARFGPSGAVQAVVKWARADRAGDFGHQVALVRAISDGLDARGAAAPDALRRWTEELTGKLLASADQGQLLAGIELSGALKVASMRKKLVAKAVAR